MRPLLVSVFVIIAITNVSAQFAPNFVPAFPDDPDRKPWTGPIADHKIGSHPSDTPEVAAAKAQHLNVYNAVRKTLPILTPEETKLYLNLPVVTPPALINYQHQNLGYVPTPAPFVPDYQPQVQHFQPVVFQPTAAPFGFPDPTYTPTVFAEEIPRSDFGEVPEVAAARAAHLKAFEEAKRLATEAERYKVQPTHFAQA